MASIDTAGSHVVESEISATLVSLRERFEAVRRGEIQRVRGRLGNLSPAQENAIDSLSHAPHRKGATDANRHVKEPKRRHSGRLCS